MNSKTRHLVAPDTLPGLEVLPEYEFSIEKLPEMREQLVQAMLDSRAHLSDATRDSVKASGRTIPGPKGAPDVDVLIYEPVNRAELCGAVLDIHGGGYVVGVAEFDEPHNRRIANELGLIVVSVEYRLPPETPHPGPIEDCYAALAWLFENADDMGVDRERIGVFGESAGGGLAAALAILARDRTEYDLAYQCLLFPMLDDRTAVEADPNPFTGEFVWRREDNHFGWSCLLGHEPGASGVSPYASPARVEDMTGLPDTFIFCGALDMFVDENIVYAKRLIRAGVPTELHIYPGFYHGAHMVETAKGTVAMWDKIIKSMGSALAESK